jgi:hypothetical protein
MKRYIEGLRRHVDRVNQERGQAASIQTMQPQIKPLEQQLVEFLRTLSQEQLRHPWTMNQIVLSGELNGKIRNRPHPQNVAEILVKLNWRKVRLYGAEFGGKRYWIPPESGSS